MVESSSHFHPLEESSMRYIAYYRVSTDKQGISRLGLEAQEYAIKDFLRNYGGVLYGEFKEVESGKNDDRLQLKKAIEYAKLTNSILLVAKLDRLSRDMHFLTSLKKLGIRFRIADMPFVDPLTLNILGALAEHEAKMISDRTKAALARLKARGQVLGNPILNEVRCHDTNPARNQKILKQQEFYQNLLPIIQHLLQEDFTTAPLLCQELERRGIRKRDGKPFTPSVMNHFLKRFSLR